MKPESSVSAMREAAAMRSPHTTTREKPKQQQRPSTAKNKPVTRTVAEGRILRDLIFHLYIACKFSLMITSDFYKSMHILRGGCILFKRSISI